jgi:outer membrane protein assembly factor BamE (lipoprotein component of BamABCDE complex)
LSIGLVIYYISSVKSSIIINFLLEQYFKTEIYMNRLIVIIIALTLSSCQSVNTRGTFIDDAAIDQAKNQQMTKDQLLYTLGEPTLKPDYSPNKWYYVSRTVRNKAWAEPSLMKQRIVEVVFKGDMVDEINVLDRKYQPSIPISRESTVSRGTEENPVQTFVKNFGRFNKSKKAKRR